MVKLERRQLQSYGFQRVHSFFFKPRTEEELAECVDFALKKGLRICPLGGSMSFSDVCLISDQICLDASALDAIKSFDERKGIITGQAGALNSKILSLIMPQGWYLTGLTGSLKNTAARLFGR